MNTRLPAQNYPRMVLVMSSKKKQKILIVTDAWHPQVNGVVRTLSQTRKELIELNYEVFILTPEGFATLPCPTYPEIRLSLFPGSKVAKRIREISPDYLHIATEGPLGLSARSFAKRNGVKFTTAYHTRFPEYVYSRCRLPLVITYSFLRWFHRSGEAVLAPTKTVVEDLEKYDVGNPVLWPRGVDLNHFIPATKRKKNPRPIFIYVGRVSVEKNIEAFLSLNLDGEKWVVGDGPAMNRLKSEYPSVNFYGMKARDELPAFYQQADVFVFPSKTDTFGLVLLEAMACGLPVAAYPVTGPIDVVGDGGVLDHDLYQACQRALKKQRSKVRAYAEKFSWENATRILQSHLVLGRNPNDYNILDNPYKNNTGVRRAFAAASNSFSGLRFAIAEESAFRQELTLAIPMLLLALTLPVELSLKLLMVFSTILVLIVELLNSSIEAAVDRVSFSHHGLSKRAKDYGSAAVLISLVLCLVVYASGIIQALSG